MKFVAVKVVLDSNVWLSGLFWKGEANQIIKLVEQNKLTSLISEEILQEIAGVLSKESKFQKFLQERKQNIESVIRKIISLSEILKIKDKLLIIQEDLSDNKFLEVALEGDAAYIISYDAHLLNLKKFKDITIIPPIEFLKKTSS